MKLVCQLTVLAMLIAGCSSSSGLFGRDAGSNSDGGADTTTPDRDTGDSAPDGAARDVGEGADSADVTSVPWPPAIDVESDDDDIEDDDTSVVLLDGEAVLEFTGTDLSGTNITVTRELVDVGDGVELVGYIWGPHGMPIEPAARVSFVIEQGWLPPGVAPEEAQLLLVPDGGLPTPLPNQTVSPVGNEVRLSADLSALGTIAVGPIPSP